MILKEAVIAYFKMLTDTKEFQSPTTTTCKSLHGRSNFPCNFVNKNTQKLQKKSEKKREIKKQDTWRKKENHKMREPEVRYKRDNVERENEDRLNSGIKNKRKERGINMVKERK